MHVVAKVVFVLSVLSVLGCSTPTISKGSHTVLGELKLQSASKVEKHAGIWIDGKYLGYLDELKGSKRILLTAGEHEIVARLSGHEDFSTTVEVVPGQKRLVPVALAKKPTSRRPDAATMAKVKLLVEPERAAVFVNDRYVGPVEQFRGFRKFLGLKPGTYEIKITLPGYELFRTEMDLGMAQDYEIRTTLREGDISDADSLIHDPDDLRNRNVVKADR